MMWRERLEDMNRIRSEKLKGWTVYTVRSFPKLKELDEITYLGSFSWTQTKTKTKYIIAKHALDIGGGVCTPSDIARDYIVSKWKGKKLRCTKYQYAQFVKNRKSQPLYAVPISGVQASYLDLKSAYWQALMLGGWDVDYSRGSFLSVRSDMLDFPCPHLKLARNTLVSIGLPSRGNMWIPDKGFKHVNGGGAFNNLVLYGFIMDFLHNFAHEIVTRCHAVYANTDGYIVPDEYVKDAFSIADEWGVLLTHRHSGKATVRGVGDYDIGNHISKRKRLRDYGYDNITPSRLEWFKRRWLSFADRIDMDYQGMLSLSEFTKLEANYTLIRDDQNSIEE